MATQCGYSKPLNPEPTEQQPKDFVISASRCSEAETVAAHLSSMPLASLGMRLYEQNSLSGAGRRSFHQKPLNSTWSLWYLQGSRVQSLN